MHHLPVHGPTSPPRSPSQITLPAHGARLVVASDGLWDAASYKNVIHNVRTVPAEKAAARLVQGALKAKGPRDDITVIVVDLAPDSDTRGLPCLDKGGPVNAPCVAWDPITAPAGSEMSGWEARVGEWRRGILEGWRRGQEEEEAEEEEQEVEEEAPVEPAVMSETMKELMDLRVDMSDLEDGECGGGMLTYIQIIIRMDDQSSPSPSPLRAVRVMGVC